jgi:hypothetical protein
MEKSGVAAATVPAKRAVVKNVLFFMAYRRSIDDWGGSAVVQDDSLAPASLRDRTNLR